MNNTVDLHTHSTASDGTFTPRELIRLAAEKRLRAIALTDHDCLDGLPEAMEEAQGLGIELIPGVEISAEFSEGTMHILGFFVEWRDGAFRERLERLQAARRERNPKIVQNLRDQGLDITLEEVAAASGGGLVGRPHFAKVLVRKGYVSSTQEAFERYLKKGAPGYAEKFRFGPEESIRMIHEAGGAAVLAHPFTLSKDAPAKIEAAVRDLAAAGLDGIEVYYGTYSNDQIREYRKLAEQYGLLHSGGSDFHGAYKPGLDLGVGYGDLKIPYSLIEPLRKKAKERAAAS